MPLHLTSCVPVRGPGFSASECLGLARRFQEVGSSRPLDVVECERWNCEGRVVLDEGLSPREVATIVAALRAYAR